MDRLNIAKLRSRLGLTVLLLLGGSLLYAGVFIYFDYREAIQRAEKRGTSFASSLEAHAGRAFAEADRALLDVIEEINFKGGLSGINDAELRKILRKGQKDSPQIGSIIVVNRLGELFASSLDESNHRTVQVDDRDYYQYHREQPSTEAFISRPIKSRVTDKWTFTLSRRLNSPSGSFAGLVAVAFSTDYFNRYYSAVDLGSASRIMLLRRDGVLLMLAPFEEKLMNHAFASRSLFTSELPQSPSGIYHNPRSTIDQSPRIIAYRSVEQFPLVVAVSQNRDEALNNWRRLALGYAAGGVLLFALAITLYVMLQRRLGSLEAAGAQLESQKRELEESERRYVQMLENVQLIAVMLDLQGRITFCNDFLVNLTGWGRSELLGGDWFDIFIREEPKLREIFLNGIRERNIPAHFENNIVTRMGESRRIAWSNCLNYDAERRLVGVTSIGEDITEKVNLQERLLQSRKMEALGTLAGGVAHDFNNILTIIIGTGELMQISLPEKDPLGPDLEQILDASRRAAAMTRKLLAFSRKQSITARPISLNSIVENIRPILPRMIGEDIHLEFELSSDALTVPVDGDQIEQVLLNLAANARDAMRDGGRIMIRTEEFRVDEQFSVSNGIATGRYALLTFADNGVGMDRATAERVFEPFFTTKERGKGTGLGLSTAYGVIRQHNGHITVSSVPGQGTTFRVYLPLVLEDAEFIARLRSRLPRGAERILVAEDDANVMRIIRTILERYGYSVLCAKDGVEAVEKFRMERDFIDLAILDVIMPNKNGREAYDEIIGINPDVRVLFMSGYTDDIISRKGIFDGSLKFIAKPITPETLLARVREILDAPKPSAN